MPGRDLLTILNETGFEEAELVADTGFSSSPVTKGVLFRAAKLAMGYDRRREMAAMKPARQTSTQQQLPGDAMEQLLKRAFELGAEKGKIIDTRTISFGEWVRWKCQYGCPMHDKGAFHPRLAPDTESTKKMIGEYSKAILLNGSDGKGLTEVAVKLEGEAYWQGYYKAFALVALAPGSGTDCGDASAASDGARPSGEPEVQVAPSQSEVRKLRITPMMEACGIDVFEIARDNGFQIDTRKETYGRWNYFALVLIG